MRLSKIALEAVSRNGNTRNRLALVLGRAQGSINRYVRNNEENGDLTKLAALEIIKRDSGLTVEQILEITPGWLEEIYLIGKYIKP